MNIEYFAQQYTMKINTVWIMQIKETEYTVELTKPKHNSSNC